MDTFTDILAMIGFFFLRLGVPLLITIGVGLLLRRLDTRWEAEAWEQTRRAPARKEVERRESDAYSRAQAHALAPHDARPCLRCRRRCLRPALLGPQELRAGTDATVRGREAAGSALLAGQL